MMLYQIKCKNKNIFRQSVLFNKNIFHLSENIPYSKVFKSHTLWYIGYTGFQPHPA